MCKRQTYDSWTGPKLLLSADSTTPYTHEWLALQWNQARELGPNTLLVIDEVQKISGWNESIKFLFDRDRESKQLKVVLLGSASLSIQEGLSESLVGRFEIIKAPHWSFKECKEAFGYSVTDFITYGGYPAAAELRADFNRWKSFISESIVERVLGRDILGIVKIGKPALFRQTFELSMKYPSQEISFQKLLGQLQERGNVTTIKHYLELMENAYLLKLLYKFSNSSVAATGSSPKILPLNNALINSYANSITTVKEPEWRGRLFESAIGTYLNSLPGRLS